MTRRLAEAKDQADTLGGQPEIVPAAAADLTPDSPSPRLRIHGVLYHLSRRNP
jgi:hypothetical protein